MAASYEQLIARRVSDRLQEQSGYEAVYVDYGALLQANITLQKRNRELERRASQSQELAESLRSRAKDAELVPDLQRQLEASTSRARALQDELTDTLRKRASLSEELLVSRQSNEQLTRANTEQAAELDRRAKKLAELSDRVAELSRTVDLERAARALACDEAEARLADREEAMKKAERLEAEHSTLITRMMELKLEQATKMNEINELYKEVESLRQQAKALQEAAANAANTGASAQAVLAAIAAGETDFTLVGVPRDPFRREKGHEGGVYACCFSRNGERFATVGGDRFVRIWDSATGAQLSTFQAGGAGALLDVTWTADDRYVIAASSDKAVRVFDLSTGRERHTMTGHEKKVFAVRAFPSDKTRAASCGEDRTLRVWDLNTGFCKHTFMGCHSTPTALEVPVDGLMLVSGHFDGKLRVWDIRAGKQLMETPAIHTAPIVSMSCTRIGSSVFTLSRDSTVAMVDTRSFEVAGTLSADGFGVSSSYGQVAISGEGWYCAAGSLDGRIFVWDIRKNAVTDILKSDKGRAHDKEPVYGVAWNHQGAPLATGDRAGNLVLWRMVFKRTDTAPKVDPMDGRLDSLRRELTARADAVSEKAAASIKVAEANSATAISNARADLFSRLDQERDRLEAIKAELKGEIADVRASEAEFRESLVLARQEAKEENQELEGRVAELRLTLERVEEALENGAAASQRLDMRIGEILMDMQEQAQGTVEREGRTLLSVEALAEEQMSLRALIEERSAEQREAAGINEHNMQVVVGELASIRNDSSMGAAGAESSLRAAITEAASSLEERAARLEADFAAHVDASLAPLADRMQQLERRAREHLNRTTVDARGLAARILTLERSLSFKADKKAVDDLKRQVEAGVARMARIESLLRHKADTSSLERVQAGVPPLVQTVAEEVLTAVRQVEERIDRAGPSTGSGDCLSVHSTKTLGPVRYLVFPPADLQAIVAVSRLGVTSYSIASGTEHNPYLWNALGQGLASVDGEGCIPVGPAITTCCSGSSVWPVVAFTAFEHLRRWHPGAYLYSIRGASAEYASRTPVTDSPLPNALWGPLEFVLCSAGPAKLLTACFVASPADDDSPVSTARSTPAPGGSASATPRSLERAHVPGAGMLHVASHVGSWVQLAAGMMPEDLERGELVASYAVSTVEGTWAEMDLRPPAAFGEGPNPLLVFAGAPGFVVSVVRPTLGREETRRDLEGHSLEVTTVAIHEAGSQVHVASGDVSGTLCVWVSSLRDEMVGRGGLQGIPPLPLKAQVKPFDGPVTTLSFNRRGTVLAAAGLHGRRSSIAILHQTPGGQWIENQRLVGHLFSVTVLAFSPHEDWTLVSGGEDGTARVWRVAPVRRRDGPAGTSAISVSISALSSPGSRPYDSPGHSRYGTPPGTDRDRRGDRDEQPSSRERVPRSLFSNQGREASWSPSPGNGDVAGHGSPGPGAPPPPQQQSLNGSGSGYGGYSSDLHGVPEEGEHDPEAELEDTVLAGSISASLASSRGESTAGGAGAAGAAVAPGENGMQLLEPAP